MGRNKESSFSPPIETPGGSFNLRENKGFSLKFEGTPETTIDALDKYVGLLIRDEEEAQAQLPAILSSVSEEEKEELETLTEFARELYSKCRRTKLQPPPAEPLPIKSLEKAS